LINYHLTALHSDKYIQGLVSALLQSCVALSKVISDIKLQESGQDLYHFYSGIIREGEAFDMDQKNWLTQYFHTDLTCNLILGLKRHGIIKIRKGSRDDFKLTSTGLEFIKVLREYYSYLSELDNFVSNTDSTQFNNLENSFKIDMIVPESLEIFVRKETRFMNCYCAHHNIVYSNEQTYFRHSARLHSGFKCNIHNYTTNSYKSFYNHCLNSHFDIQFNKYNIITLFDFIDELDPLINFSQTEKELIIHKVNQLNTQLSEFEGKSVYNVSKVFIAILFLHLENKDSRASRHLDFNYLYIIFRSIGRAKPYTAKNIKLLLRKLNFDWMKFKYSYQEGFLYYGSIILRDPDFNEHLVQRGIDVKSFRTIWDLMFSFLVGSASLNELTKYRSSLPQFVLKSIVTFSEMLGEWFSPGHPASNLLTKADIESIIDTNLSSLPYISEVQVGRMLRDRKSLKLEKYIFNFKNDLFKIYEQNSIDQSNRPYL
ncbi:MAG: hypothetical protein HeimC2_31900, partial [Candidatus Heimdallarchaeota archaeon LC_2]